MKVLSRPLATQQQVHRARTLHSLDPTSLLEDLLCPFQNRWGDLSALTARLNRVIQLQVAQVLRSEVNFVLPICPSLGDVPRSLPSFLLAYCGDPASWIYSDQKCDGTNNCGDCSDELSPGGGLGTGGQEQAARQ